MKKKSVKLLIACLLSCAGVASAAGAAGSVMSVKAASGVAENAPFYDGPMCSDKSSVTKRSDGSYAVSQTTGGCGTRLFYGDYVSGGAENAYLLDLTDTEITFSVDSLAAGQGIELAFMSFRQNGDMYPMQGYGQGFSVLLADDGGGNTGFCPRVSTFSLDGGYSPYTTTGNDYLVYNNTSPRDSYLEKDMKLHIFAGEDKLNIEIDWVRDGNNGAAYDYRAELPLNVLPVTGDYAFDYTKSYFMIGNSGAGMNMTLEDISEPATNAYYEKYGGKYHNSARYTEEYRIAANALGGETATGADVKEYYYTEMNFLGVDPSGMRKSDRYEYDAAKSISTAGFDEKALALKEEVFAGYTVDSDITNERDAIGAFAFYTKFSDRLTEYEVIANHIREALSEKDFGQKAVEASIAGFLEKYSAAVRENYKPALADYDKVLKEYAALSAFAKGMVSNYAALESWKEETLVEMKGLYYSTEGSYFTNEYDYTEEDGKGSVTKCYAGAVRNEDGSTKLLLSDDTTNRLVYGTDIKDGKWTDYAVNLSDFEMKFTVDSSAANARFAINFVSHRSALPYGDEINPGLSLFFRMGFDGPGSAGVALTETKGGIYPNSNPDTPALEGFTNDWGGFGSLKCAEGIVGKTITVRLAAEEAGVRLTVSAEGSADASILLTNEYLAAVFATEKGAIDTSKLALTFSVGEGMESYSGNSDIELTVKQISDEYADFTRELFADFETYKSSVAALSGKTSLTFDEIRSINAKSENIAVKEGLLRRYEAETLAAKKAELSAEALAKIDAMAIDYFKGQMNALAGVTPDNYIEKRTALTKFEEQWKVVTASQKELYAECADAVAAVEADIAGCGLAKGVIDDIAALVAKTPLPATIETLREEYAALKVRYEGLAEKYKAQVTNGDDFTAYGELLDAYDPAQSVENAIEKLFVDYATINSSNKNEAKEALAAVRAAYEELTESQKQEVSNFAKTDEFEEKIAAFEQSQIDYSVAAAFDREVVEKTGLYAEITAENKAAALADVAALKEKYEALTQAQKDFSEKYSLVGELEEKISAFEVQQTLKEAAEAVDALIAGIGRVENTSAFKNKIDAARAAYDALSAEAKALVSGLSALEKAESDYAALQESSEGSESGSSSKADSGCGSSIGALGGLMATVVLAAGAALAAKKKSDDK